MKGRDVIPAGCLSLERLRDRGVAGTTPHGKELEPAVKNAEYRSIELERILPTEHELRDDVEDGIEAIVASIREHGVLQPVGVVAIGGGRYRRIFGGRRCRAAGLAGLREVPCRVFPIPGAGERELMSLFENTHREDLNPIELATALGKLAGEGGFTHGELAHRLGKERTYVTEMLSLLRLPHAVQTGVARATISRKHAKELLRLPDEDLQKEAYHEVIDKDLSVRETRRLVERMLRGDAGREPDSDDSDGEFYRLIELLEDRLGRKVAFKRYLRRREFRVSFTDMDDFMKFRRDFSRLRLEDEFEFPTGTSKETEQ